MSDRDSVTILDALHKGIPVEFYSNGVWHRFIPGFHTLDFINLTYRIHAN